MGRRAAQTPKNIRQAAGRKAGTGCLHHIFGGLRRAAPQTLTDKATGDEAKGAEKGDKGKAKVEKSGGDEAKGGSNKAKPESKEVVEPQKDAKAS